jgi:ABC-type multidrug transport system permease subunit
MIRPLPAFALASLAALAGGWAFMAGVGGQTFAVGLVRMPVIYLLTPLLALALFQIVFGALSGLWRGWRFWAAALPFAMTVWGFGLVLSLSANAPPATALALVVVVLLAFGIWALLQHEGRR